MPVWQYLKHLISIESTLETVTQAATSCNNTVNRLYKSIQQKWQISTQIPILSISVFR